MIPALFRTPGSRFIRDPEDLRLGDVVRRKCDAGCICIAGAPWDWSTAGRPGARYATTKLRDYLYSLNIHEDICVCDAGDIDIAPGDITTTSSRIYNAVRELLSICRGFLLLGGDHSITKYSVSAVLDRRGSGGGLVVFDAHLDLRRLSEGLSSGTYLRELLEERGSGLKVVVVGVRRHSVPRYMLDLARRLGVTYIESEDLDPGEAVRIINEILSEARWIYISFDSDSLDPHQCPGVNSPSPLGLAMREAVEILDGISKTRRLVGGDIVEYVPILDHGEICGRNLAYIAYRMIHLMGS
ncbi:MAG: arginase family protein [Sulfolobales archaeon]